MKIQSNGFMATEICEQIPSILVSSDGMVRINFRSGVGGGLTTSSAMTAEEFAELHAAMDAVRDRLPGGSVRPSKVRDKSGDEWTWLDSHNAYVIEVDNHQRCTDDGRSLEDIKEGWGPVTVIE